MRFIWLIDIINPSLIFLFRIETCCNVVVDVVALLFPGHELTELSAVATNPGVAVLLHGGVDERALLPTHTNQN